MMAFGHILCPDAVPAEGSRAKCEDRALLCHPVTQCRQPLFSLLHGDHRLSFPQFMRQVTCIFFVELGFPVGRAHQEPTDDDQSMISGRDSSLAPPKRDERNTNSRAMSSKFEVAPDVDPGTQIDTYPDHEDDTLSDTSSSVSSDEEQERQSLSRIASSRLGQVLSATHAKNEPQLDPNSPEFDHRRWAQFVLRRMHECGIEPPQQGVVFKDLQVSGSGSALQYQETVLSTFAIPFRTAARAIAGQKRMPRRQILRGFDGLLEGGELLLVLGRPGSGCSTLLKTICGRMGGLTLEPESTIHYNGVGYEDMIKHHRGEIAYNKEVDEHFPHLTVGQTLSFAAHARAPRRRIEGVTRTEFADTMTKVVMSVYGLSHTVNTKVGDNFIRGVSGGERKRVSIAEMFLSNCRIGAWDNSTRGLDAASALKFVRALRLSADMSNSCHAVAAYQASQSMYDLFEKVVVLYEGYEIYFGRCDAAVEYFQRMGWERPEKQVSPDFLTAITNPLERRARPGMEDKVPRSAKEFSEYWKRSVEYQNLRTEIGRYVQEHAPNGEAAQILRQVHEEKQARHTRTNSPYLLSIPMQIRLCVRRAYQRLRNDLPTAMSTVVVQTILSLIIGSVFYNSPNSSNAFFQKGAILYFSVLMNALITIGEIMQLYAQRPIVEKQAAYAFVHPFTEALASALVDLPIKILRCSVFSIILYFLANLRREPSQFFIFYLLLICTILTMSGMFRSLASLTQTVGQAMALAGILVLCIVVYTGFTLPQPYMHPWLSWIRWINPVYYAFEALVSNEFHGRNFECTSYIPSYGTGTSFICSVVGAVAGERFVSGDAFIQQNYQYSYSHLWRNFGILIAFLIFFHVLYLTATEFISADKSTAEALVFRPGHAPSHLQDGDGIEAEKTNPTTEVRADADSIRLPEQKDILSWKSVCYDIPVKDGTRRLLDNVNGWVKPGTLTALMGVSGAGKTTLLDVLAQRVSIGVVTGDIFVNGKGLAANFPRRTGYVQQQDLHLETTTVREALRFSAMLRQPRSVSQQEKYDYVEQVIQVLGMEDYAEAVVGRLGEGLNVEQRKLLSIGVELAAKPTLLVFLDEPTSGLDSQSSWTICAFLKKLTNQGQAVLATIHQPSAMLFQTFDRLLFLAKGGKTVYFGDIGKDSRTLLDYFERNGGRICKEHENPAEYILETVSGDVDNNAPDWVKVWDESPEHKDVLAELDRLHSSRENDSASSNENAESKDEFAMPLHSQLYHVLRRVFQQYLRQPEYIFSKFILGIVSGLFIGFSFWKTDNTQQGFQNSLFSIFLLCTIFNTLVNQIMPKFVAQRALYEVRERPSRVYSWKVFILSQMIVEIPFQFGLGVCSWASFYWSVFGANQDSERRALIMLFIVQFFIYSASMAQFVVCAVGEPALASMIATLMFGLSFVFSGVMQPPPALPGFWIFMYRVSPFTYYIGGIGSTALHGRPVQCSSTELSVFDPPDGQTCGEYMAKYLNSAGGQLYNMNATSGCEYCAMDSADQYLAQRWIYWEDRWRNYGIFWAYFVFNIVGAITLYYLFRRRVSLDDDELADYIQNSNFNDDPHAAEVEERKNAWRGLMAASFRAILSSYSAPRYPGAQIPLSLTIHELNIVPISVFSTREFHDFLSHLTGFNMSLMHGAGWMLNTFKVFYGFPDCLGPWFFNHLTSAEEFSFDPQESAPLGDAGQRHAFDISLRKANMPRLRKLSLGNIYLCLELKDFLLRHLDTLESISLHECYSCKDLDGVEGMSWSELFCALADKSPTRLTCFSLHWDDDQEDLPDLDDDMGDPMLVAQVRRKLEIESDAMAFPFGYCDVSEKYGNATHDWDANRAAFVQGDDYRSYQDFMAIVESNATGNH
ncbi:ABC-2 type transporter [Aspergillus oryzae]|uniref:ABC-2 type transporter n=3 Tax=Aspergillus oryzae TaxID=5062 RepID=A0A1S9DBQ2_ASPOZ|nr:ABC-2 type transporter [Aspergillus oryzae]